MGNVESQTKIINDFILNFHGKNLNDIDDQKKKVLVEELLTALNNDKNLYKTFRQNQQVTDIDSTKEEAPKDNKIENDKKEENENKAPIKCIEFCSCLCALCEYDYNYDSIDILSNLVKILIFMVREDDFYKMYRVRVIDKFLKRLEEKDALNNGKKIDLMLNMYDLFYETLCHIFDNKDRLKYHLSVLNKLYNLPKKNHDKVKNRSVEFQIKKYLILEKIFEIMKFISESREGSSGKSINASEELMKTILYDYNLNGIYREMVYDLEMKQASRNETIKKLIINCYTNLSYIDYVIIGKYLSDEHIEKLTKFLTMDSMTVSQPEMIINPIKFLINFYIKSYDLGINENFKIFVEDKTEIIKSIFSIMYNLADPNLHKSEENFQIIFLISCLFITLSIKSSVWEKLNEKKIIKPCCDCIKKFIYDTFSKKFFPNGEIMISNKNNKTDEEIQREKELVKKNIQNRFGMIKLLAKILGFIAKETVYKNIYHLEFFKWIFEFVIDLFHIDFTEINRDIYSIFNVCTYFTDCKLYLYLYNEKTFNMIKKDLFKRIDLSLANYKYLKKSIENNDKMKTYSLNKKQELENEEIKSKVDEKMRLFENINTKTKIFAQANFDDFTILISILCNLLMMNDFNIFKKLLLGNLDSEFNTQGFVESFKKKLEEFIEIFEKKENLKERNEMFSKIIHPAKLFLMIIDPTITFSGGKKEEYLNKDKNVIIDIITDYKAILESSKNDDESLHKILFILYRFLMKYKIYPQVINFVEEIILNAEKVVYKPGSCILVNREWLRLLNSLLSSPDNILFWLKCDPHKCYIDAANNYDVVVKYKEEQDLMGKKIIANFKISNPFTQAIEKSMNDKLQIKSNKNANRSNQEEIIGLPFQKVSRYNDMGIITFSRHYLYVPKIINLGSSYTIFFRFYYPLINTESEHVLLQDITGKGALIAFTRDRKRLISYTKDGKIVDSFIDLEQHKRFAIQPHKWLCAALSYSKLDNQTKVSFYFQGELAKCYEVENYKLPENIAYIGNSKEFINPFGAFCDLRIYPNYMDLEGYRHLLSNIDGMSTNINNTNFRNTHKIYIKQNIPYVANINLVTQKFLEFFQSPSAKGNPINCNDYDNTEESFYFLIKLLNGLLIYKDCRNIYINYDLIFKMMGFLCSKSSEIKKDISKFLNTIS